MSVTRDFDAMIAEKAGIRPTYRIAGQEFTLRSRLPFAKWDKLLSYMRADDTSNMEATAALFQTVLIRADRERFMQLLAGENTPDDDDETYDEQAIGLDQMGPLTDWVMEYFTGKLKSNEAGLSPGSPETGPSRNVVSLSARNTAS